jgi:hypothetical protein
MLTENIEAKGRVRFVLRDETTGEIKQDYETENLVVTVGLQYIASRMVGTTPAVMTHMGVGTSSTAAAAGQTDLVASSARVTLTSTTIVTGTVANDSVQYVATFPAGTATATLQEAGVFNAVSAGTMLCRTVFGAITKGANDSLTITWTVRVAG